MTGPLLARAESQDLRRLSELAHSLAEGLACAAACGLPSRPDAAPMIRAYLRARRRRDDLFGSDLFADPVWDMLLDLYASALEGRQVCVSDACIASSVPSTTALRWLGKMEVSRLVVRRFDTADARRVYVELSPSATSAVATWLEHFLADLRGRGPESEFATDPAAGLASIAGHPMLHELCLPPRA